MDGTVIVGIVAGLAILWVLMLAVLWLLRPKGVPAREVLGVVPDLVRLARSVLTDRAVPLDVRLAVGGAIVWLVSPIDLIPEFIPVLGPLDDVIVTVLALRYVRRRLGSDDLRRRWVGSEDGFTILTKLMGT